MHKAASIGLAASCGWLATVALLPSPSLAEGRVAGKPSPQTVVVVTDVPGFLPDEIDDQVSYPIQLKIMGLAEVVAVRSASSAGRSTVWVDFKPTADLYAKRQAVAEQLQRLQPILPIQARPKLAPAVARGREITVVVLTSASAPGAAGDPPPDGVRLRTLAETVVRARLLTVPGLASVTVHGGNQAAYQVVASPDKLQALDVTFKELIAAVRLADAAARGGIQKQGKESANAAGQKLERLEDMAAGVVATRGGRPVLVKDVAEVKLGSRQAGAVASICMLKEGKPSLSSAVFLTVERGPGAKSDDVLAAIQRAIEQLRPALPAGLNLTTETFGPADLTVALRGPPEQNLERWSRLSEQAESLVAQVPGVEAVWSLTAGLESGSVNDVVSPDVANTARMYVRLSPVKSKAPNAKAAPRRTREEIGSDVRRALRDLPGLASSVGPIAGRAADSTATHAQIVLKVIGPDLDKLQAIAAEARTRLAKVAGVVDLQVDPQGDVPQLRLEIDRERAARLGIAAGDVAEIAEVACQGRVVGAVSEEGQRRELIVTYDERSRASAEVIGRTLIATAKGERVPLATLVKIKHTSGPRVLYGENGRRRIIVACNIEGGKTSDVVAAARREVAGIELPGGYTLVWDAPSDGGSAAP